MFDDMNTKAIEGKSGGNGRINVLKLKLLPGTNLAFKNSLEHGIHMLRYFGFIFYCSDREMARGEATAEVATPVIKKQNPITNFATKFLPFV